MNDNTRYYCVACGNVEVDSGHFNREHGAVSAGAGVVLTGVLAPTHEAKSHPRMTSVIRTTTILEHVPCPPISGDKGPTVAELRAALEEMGSTEDAAHLHVESEGLTFRYRLVAKTDTSAAIVPLHPEVTGDPDA